MERGLSELEQIILRVALAHRGGGAGAMLDDGPVDAFYADVLPAYRGQEHRLPHLGGRCSARAVVGEPRYSADMAALERAAAGLERRGLVIRRRGAYARWSGVWLTAAGLEAARRL